MPHFPTIVRRADFEALSRSRISASCRLLMLRVRQTNDEVTRVGLSTPRGLGGAVKRNRLRRRLREAIRVRHASIAPGWDLLVIARLEAAEASVDDLGAAFDRLLERCGVPRSSQGAATPAGTGMRAP